MLSPRDPAPRAAAIKPKTFSKSFFPEKMQASHDTGFVDRKISEITERLESDVKLRMQNKNFKPLASLKA
jgi:hypothetical protein